MLGATDFLIPNATIIVEIIALAIVFGFIAKYVVPPVNKLVTERQAQIAESLTVIDESKKLQHEAKVAYENAMSKAKDDARALLDQANKTAESIRAESRDKAQAEYDIHVARATADIEGARQAALRELESRVGELAIQVASKVIGAELDAQRHRALIEEAVAAVATQV